MMESALPGPISRFALADVVYPRGIRGVLGRTLYLLFAFPLIGIVILAVAVAAPGYLVFVLLITFGAPGWLVLTLAAAAFLFSLLWLASCFAAGVSWVVAAQAQHGTVPPAEPE